MKTKNLPFARNSSNDAQCMLFKISGTKVMFLLSKVILFLTFIQALNLAQSYWWITFQKFSKVITSIINSPF